MLLGSLCWVFEGQVYRKKRCERKKKLASEVGEDQLTRGSFIPKTGTRMAQKTRPGRDRGGESGSPRGGKARRCGGKNWEKK